MRMAKLSPSWGYARIQGAMANLGHKIAPNTVKRLLKEHGIEPAPFRRRRTTWAQFLRSHWDTLPISSPPKSGLPSKYSNAQWVSRLHLSKGCLNPASRSDTCSFRVRSSLPAARPAADLSQPCAHPVGLSPATRSPGVGSQLCGEKYPGFCADSKGV